MEDRLNSGLMLVMIDESSKVSQGDLQAQFDDTPGIGQVSWWRNVCPQRTDWLADLRTIDEFHTMAVCELQGVINPAIAPAGARSFIFRRYPRPSQGCMRLPTLGLALILVSPKDLADSASSQSLRDWADFVHFVGIMDANIPGYGMVTPYQNITDDAPRFLHMYEFPDPDAEGVFARTRPCAAQRFGGGPGTPGFDHWELHPDIAIDYVNTFCRIGMDGRDIPADKLFA
jgi:hypothetical protein